MIRECKVKTSCSAEGCDKILWYPNLLPGYKLSITGDRVKEPGRYGNDDGSTTNTTMFYDVSVSSPKCTVPEHIGVGAGKFLWVRRNFAQISPNLPEKNSKENDLKKTTASHFKLGAFFQFEALQAPFLSKFPLTCLKRTKEKHDLKKWKNVCTLTLGAIFVKSKHIQQFCESFHTFCPNCHRFCTDFKGFWRDFYQIKSYGGVLAPPAPPPPTPVPEHDACT